MYTVIWKEEAELNRYLEVATTIFRELKNKETTPKKIKTGKKELEENFQEIEKSILAQDKQYTSKKHREKNYNLWLKSYSSLLTKWETYFNEEHTAEEHDILYSQHRNKLIELNLGLVGYFIKKYPNLENEHIISASNFSAIYAANNYNFRKGSSYRNYLQYYIRTKVINFLKRQKDKKEKNSSHILEEVIKEKTIEDPLEYRTKQDELAEIRKQMDNLPKKYKEVLRLRYFQDKTFREIEDEINVTKQYASQLERKALKKLYNLYLDALHIRHL